MRHHLPKLRHDAGKSVGNGQIGRGGAIFLDASQHLVDVPGGILKRKPAAVAVGCIAGQLLVAIEPEHPLTAIAAAFAVFLAATATVTTAAATTVAAGAGHACLFIAGGCAHHLFALDLLVLVQVAHFRCQRPTTQQGIDRFGHIVVDDHVLAILDFDQHLESRRRFSFQHRLLGAAAARLFVRKGHRINAIMPLINI